MKARECADRMTAAAKSFMEAHWAQELSNNVAAVIVTSEGEEEITLDQVKFMIERRMTHFDLKCSDPHACAQAMLDSLK